MYALMDSTEPAELPCSSVGRASAMNASNPTKVMSLNQESLWCIALYTIYAEC